MRQALLKSLIRCLLSSMQFAPKTMKEKEKISSGETISIGRLPLGPCELWGMGDTGQLPLVCWSLHHPSKRCWVLDSSVN